IGLGRHVDAAFLERHPKALAGRGVALSQHDARSGPPFRGRLVSVGRFQMFTAFSALPRPSLPHAPKVRTRRAPVRLGGDTGCVKLVTESVRRSGPPPLSLVAAVSSSYPRAPDSSPDRGSGTRRRRCYVERATRVSAGGSLRKEFAACGFSLRT